MTRLGIAAMAVIYTLGLAAVFATFVSVITDWPAAPSLAAVRPTLVASPPPVTTLNPPTLTLPPASRPEPTFTQTIAPPLVMLQAKATYYCLPPVSSCTVGFPATGLYAAAGPELRAALGDWRGRKVTVWHGGLHVTVTLVDMCDCGIDLYSTAFLLLAPLSAGVIDVEIWW